MFSGRSTLRAAEAKPAPRVNKALQDYLAKYTSDGDAPNKKKKKKAKAAPAGVRILDEDLSGFAAPTAAPNPDEEDEREANFVGMTVAQDVNDVYMLHMQNSMCN